MLLWVSLGTNVKKAEKNYHNKTVSFLLQSSGGAPPFDSRVVSPSFPSLPHELIAIARFYFPAELPTPPKMQFHIT